MGRFGTRDDYSKLLPFYPFPAGKHGDPKNELDSVIYKCTAGILLHDLRNDWIDNLYLLIGKAYYYKKDFDSAAMTLQFINYNLFPRKGKMITAWWVVMNLPVAVMAPSPIKKKRNLLQNWLPSLPAEMMHWYGWAPWLNKTKLGKAAAWSTPCKMMWTCAAAQNDLEEVRYILVLQSRKFMTVRRYILKRLTNADDKQDKSRREFYWPSCNEMTGETRQGIWLLCQSLQTYSRPTAGYLCPAEWCQTAAQGVMMPNNWKQHCQPGEDGA